MGINRREPTNVIDADISFREGPYGSGACSDVVVLKIWVEGRLIIFTSEELSSHDTAQNIARALDGKRIA